MAYVRHNWTCGEVINDTRMNNIEDGIEEALNGGAEPLVLNVVDTIRGSGFSVVIYDKTGDQVAEAWQNGVPIYVDNSHLGDSTTGVDGFVPIQVFNNDEEDGVTLLVNHIKQGESLNEYTSTIVMLSEVPSGVSGEAAQYVGHMSYYAGGVS